VRVGKGIRRVAATATAAVVASAGVIAGTVVPAAAASVVPVGNVKLCNGSNYRADVHFPERGGMTSTVVNPGTCWYSGYMGGFNRPERVEFHGAWNYHEGEFLLYSTNINLSTTGIGVTAEGTTDGYWFTVW